jgi:hypothetical protein
MGYALMTPDVQSTAKDLLPDSEQERKGPSEMDKPALVGSLSAKWNLAPLCGSEPDRAAVESVYRSVATRSEMAFAQLDASFELPSLADVPLGDISRLRESDELFGAWRHALAELVQGVHQADSHDQAQFEREWNEHLGRAKSRLPAAAKTTWITTAATGVVGLTVVGIKLALNMTHDPIVDAGIATGSPAAGWAVGRLLSLVSPKQRTTRHLADMFGKLAFEPRR